MAKEKNDPATAAEQPSATPAEGTDTNVGTTPAPEAEPVPVSERPLPYKGRINVALAVIHKGVTPGKSDQPIRPVATLPQGAEVTVVSRQGELAQLANGLYIRESFIEL